MSGAFSKKRVFISKNVHEWGLFEKIVTRMAALSVNAYSAFAFHTIIQSLSRLTCSGWRGSSSHRSCSRPCWPCYRPGPLGWSSRSCRRSCHSWWCWRRDAGLVIFSVLQRERRARPRSLLLARIERMAFMLLINSFYEFIKIISFFITL